MVNMCNAYLEVSGNKEEIERFLAKLKNSEGYNPDSVSILESYLPTPLELEAIQPFVYERDGVTYNAIRTDESGEVVPVTEEYLKLLADKYGHSDWHFWRLANWSTKWCDESFVVGQYYRYGSQRAVIRMETPTTLPYKGLLTIRDRHFPNLHFKATFWTEFYEHAGVALLGPGNSAWDVYSAKGMHNDWYSE